MYQANSKQLQDTILTNAFRALLAMSASVEEAEIHGDVPRKKGFAQLKTKHFRVDDGISMDFLYIYNIMHISYILYTYCNIYYIYIIIYI